MFHVFCFSSFFSLSFKLQTWGAQIIYSLNSLVIPLPVIVGNTRKSQTVGVFDVYNYLAHFLLADGEKAPRQMFQLSHWFCYEILICPASLLVIDI